MFSILAVKYWFKVWWFFLFPIATLVIQTTTSSEHLLKHTERIRRQVHERLNIIFIDSQLVLPACVHDHKLVDRELDTFPISLRQGITTLYLRKV